jgi:hypothetical protein
MSWPVIGGRIIWRFTRVSAHRMVRRLFCRRPCRSRNAPWTAITCIWRVDMVFSTWGRRIGLVLRRVRRLMCHIWGWWRWRSVVCRIIVGRRRRIPRRSRWWHILTGRRVAVRPRGLGWRHTVDRVRQWLAVRIGTLVLLVHVTNLIHSQLEIEHQTANASFPPTALLPSYRTRKNAA